MGRRDLCGRDANGAREQRPTEPMCQERGEISAVRRGRQHDRGGGRTRRLRSEDEGQGAEFDIGNFEVEMASGAVYVDAGDASTDDQHPSAGLRTRLVRSRGQHAVAYDDDRQHLGRLERGQRAAPLGDVGSHAPHSVAPTRSPSTTAAWARRGATQSPMRRTSMPDPRPDALPDAFSSTYSSSAGVDGTASTTQSVASW